MKRTTRTRASRTSTRTFWSAKIGPLVEMVLGLDVDSLPPTPWVLKRSATVPIGKSTFFGGPFMTITNNEAWLQSLLQDLKAGPTGPASLLPP